MGSSVISNYLLQLSEAVGLQSPNSPTMAPVGEDSLGHIDSVVAMEESNLEMSSLHQRLAALEGDNAMLRASCAALQTQLDEASVNFGTQKLSEICS